MANYSQKLANMRSRRLGLDAATALTKDSRFIEAATFSEAYETRAKTDAVKYAIGAMQELEAKYSQLLRKATGSENSFNDGLKAAGIPAHLTIRVQSRSTSISDSRAISICWCCMIVS